MNQATNPRLWLLGMGTPRFVSATILIWLCLPAVSISSAQLSLPAPIPPGLELEVLRPAFSDELVPGDLVNPAVTNLDNLKMQLDSLLVAPERFPTAFGDLSLGAANFVPLAYGTTTERLRLSFTLDRPLNAYAFVRRSTNSPPGAPRMAVLLIPGSGLNQSSAIARADPTNYHGRIIDLAAAVGDTFVVVKPNEDILAIHNGTNKLSDYFVYTGLINLGGSYSALYLAQALALAKHLKATYDGLLVVGLSQGGAAALLVSLQAEPMAAVVSSGYSILMQQIQYAASNQILLPKVDLWFAKDRMRNRMTNMQTRYFFTWGRAEADFYKIEAEAGPTPAYFAPVPQFRAFIHDGGHEFPMPAVASFLDEQLRRLRLRTVGVGGSGSYCFTTWTGLQPARSYEIQTSTNFQTWPSALSVTNPVSDLRFEYIPGLFDATRPSALSVTNPVSDLRFGYIPGLFDAKRFFRLGGIP